MCQCVEFSSFYHQFYMCDQLSPLQTSIDFWNNETFAARIATAEGVVGVLISNEELARVHLEIFERLPAVPIDDASDHLAEGGLVLATGILQLRSCPDSNVELQIAIAPGTYRVRVYSYELHNQEMDWYYIQVCSDENLRTNFR